MLEERSRLNSLWNLWRGRSATRSCPIAHTSFEIDQTGSWAQKFTASSLSNCICVDRGNGEVSLKIISCEELIGSGSTGRGPRGGMKLELRVIGVKSGHFSFFF